MKLKLGLVAIASIMIILTIALTSSDAQDSTIRVAFLPSVSHAIPIVGIETGTFADALVNDTQIVTHVLDSGTQAVQSLISGNLDIAYVGPGPAVNAFVRSDNQSIVILDGAASGGVSFIAHRDVQISSPSDLDGARIAVPQIANTQDVSLRSYLAENGLTTTEHGGRVSVIAVAGPEMYTLFARNSVDAAWVPEPWATFIVESLGAKRIFYEEDLWSDSRFSSVVLVARTDYVKSHPDTIDAWLGAHAQTAQWINSNPQGTRDAYASFAQREAIAALPADVLDLSFANVEITTDRLESSIHTFAQRAADIGYLGRGDTSISGIFYTDIRDEVQ